MAEIVGGVFVKRKRCVAMLLVGGQGSRLNCLTANIAKPGLIFGGKYRIVDFCLSNCVNSGIETVGMLTQYKPFLLNSYVGQGSAWDLDIDNGGLHVLPPYHGLKGGTWYKGTANSIYQNIDFIDRYNPKYVLVLSGDHVYKMDYETMIQEHIDKNSDATIAVINVPYEEASRFGIMSVDEEDRITKFTEKPKIPESTLASMGIYIFSWEVLKDALIVDEANPHSENDFGKNVIPRMLIDKKKLQAHRFDNYWKDVGTIESYYFANMELLGDSPSLDLFEKNFKIISNLGVDARPPQFIGAKSAIKNSLISNGCTILGHVENSLISPGVTIKEGAVVKDSIVVPDVIIMEKAKVNKSIIGENVVVGEGAVIGTATKTPVEPNGITIIEDNVGISPKSRIVAGSEITI